MNARMAPPPISRPVDVEGPHRHRRQRGLVRGTRACHVLAGELRDGVRPARLAHGADGGRSLRGRSRRACRRPRSWRSRRSVRRSLSLPARPRALVGADEVHAHGADGALEDGVDARDAGAVDDVRRSRGQLRQRVEVEHVGLVEAEVRVVEQLRASASRWRLSTATTTLSSTSRRASVVPMKPAPPVTKMRFPVSATRRV